jgi:hypothetical protein
MRIATAAKLLGLLAVLGAPRPGAAQLVNSNDPCYVKLTQQGLWNYFELVKWADTPALETAQLRILEFAQEAEGRVAQAQKELAEGKTLSAARMAAFADLNDCYPWLIALASRLDNELKKRGVSIFAPVPGERGRQNPLERALVARDIAQSLEQIAEGLKTIVKARGS